MLEQGQESEAILRLAGDGNLNDDLRAALVTEAVHDMNLQTLLDDDALDAAYERASVADYYAGVIDGWTLIQRGCNLHYKSGEKLLRSYWIVIAGEAGQHEQGICFQYPFNERSFDDVLREALNDHGFPQYPDRGV